jgi:hypothetical protein
MRISMVLYALFVLFVIIASWMR